MMKMISAAILAGAAVGLSGLAQAAVSSEEAARLKSELTPLGGEKAGNKEGTIPAWTGGYATTPAGYKSGQPRPDPFAADKPVLTITAANVAEHASKLDEAQIYLLKKFSDYKVNVYPTRRTAVAPQWVYDETFKNATRAKLDGYTLSGAYGGIPFPIPKTGNELMWNHLLRVRPESFNFPFNSWVVDSKGVASLGSGATNEWTTPYYRKGGSPADVADGNYYTVIQTVTAPSVRAGELLLIHGKLDNSQPAWQYLVGQRRVRRAPTICCDTPNFVNSGVDFFDQPFVWLGPFDRYSWRVVGKKEMYIPYNNNRLVMTKDRDALKPHFINPDFTRWELHRVWELEGTVREGQRDVRPKRKVYLDEDTYIAVIGNTWDAQGTLWHTSIGFPFMMFETPSIAMETFSTFDFIKGTYTYTSIGDQKEQVRIFDEPLPSSYYTPDALARKGVR